ncbi:hypothetical protein ONZ45_g13793 [Pleurotus djamor]|nr:hypothetical protein ONZ45_g13793 [Pleurotus djamor]
MPLTFDEDNYDLGVDRFSSTQFSDLSRLLAFKDGLPIHWNQYARTDGVTLWDASIDAAARRAFKIGGDGFRSITPLWHQLVGVCSMMFKLFTATETEHVPGTILADDVGVGKTTQVMASIAFTQQVYIAEQKQTTRPPLVHDRPFYRGKGPVPNAAHLIIVPLCLMGQWRKELQTFFAPGAIDVIDIPPATLDVETFFTDRSTQWGSSGQQPIDRVVLCSHSTFEHLVAKTFHPSTTDGALPVDHPLMRRQDSEDTITIFDIPWAGVYVDEGHLFRGDTRNFSGVIQLRLAGNHITIISATPLYNKPHDVLNIARMIGIVKCCLGPGHSYEKEIDRRLQAAKRTTALDSEPTLEELLVFIQSEAEADNELAITKREIMAEFQAVLGENIIRCTLSSKKPDGSPLNDKLPVVHSHIITVTLTEREHKNLGKSSGKIKRRGGGVRSDFNLECFWLSYRLAVLFYVLKGTKYPVFLSNGETEDGLKYEDVPSTKLNMLIAILQHLLSHDDIGHLEEGQKPPQTRKIIVNHHFTMQVPMIVSVLNFHGINVFIINGSQKQPERERILHEFINGTDPAWRVLLFSSVGGVGLNLTCADVVIMLDALWSQVAVEQVVGRCARLTQEKPVHVYYILAKHTTDIAMAALARDKGDMLKALLNRQWQDDDINQLLLGGVDDGEEEEENEDDDNDDDSDDSDANTSRAPKKKTGRTAASTSSKKLTAAGPGEAQQISSHSKKKTLLVSYVPSHRLPLGKDLLAQPLSPLIPQHPQQQF